jgi:hypothetical protein
MVRYARTLAEEYGVEVPPGITTDFAACKAFLDEHASSKATRLKARNGSMIRKNRPPGAISDRPLTVHERALQIMNLAENSRFLKVAAQPERPAHVRTKLLISETRKY